MRNLFLIVLMLFMLGIMVSPVFAGTLSNIYATPCPFDLSQTINICSFIGIPEGATITIYDMAGRTVRKLDAPVWDGRNAAGEMVSSGTYIYRVVAENGDKFTGKLAVVK